MSVATTARAEVWSSSHEAEAKPLEAAQIPLSTLLLATILSGSLWWGIIAAVRWIWR